MSGETHKADLAIRARPRPVKRFSKKVLMVGAGGLALMLSAALAFALQPVEYDTGKSTELYNVTHKPMADEIERLPKTYADLKTVQSTVLGPPLPGDLGRAYLNNGNGDTKPETDNPFRYEPGAVRTAAAPRRTTARPPEQDPKMVQKVAARQSGLFFDVGGTITGAPLQTYADPFAALSGLPELGFDQSKTAAQTPSVSNQVYNSGEVQSPRSPYQVMAGTLLPATLVTGLNSDLPGQVIGQVTENIYDTVTGRHLLIPQGAKLIGSYESRNSYGDKRAFVSWSRLIFPNGDSIMLDDLGAIDGLGQAGLRDKVDGHTGKIIKASVLSSVLGIGAELASDDDDRIVRALQNSGQQTLNIAGQRMVDRSLNVEPTITIRPGWRFSVLVSRDLVLKPYTE
ncbi:MAG: TrbI/VirB10 family protein [Hellea sp.]|nr:TrbI/VirB10 family protein [Hellea sp.]